MFLRLLVGCGMQHILSEPEDIVSMSGAKLPLKCSVDYISFSAHTDYKQTSQFIRALKPGHIVSNIYMYLILNITHSSVWLFVALPS